MCAQMRAFGCKAAIDVGANDGYVDLTVECGQLEYSLGEIDFICKNLLAQFFIKQKITQ